jgi:uncharacterized protein YdbL (DUF1318 family)
METMKRAGLMASLLALVACVTINVYFPAAAAERAADRIIEDVWGEDAEDAPDGSPAQSGAGDTAYGRLAARLFAAIIPTADAAEPDLNVSTPAISQIQASMQQRHRLLEPMYAAGAIGLTNNGLLTVRDLKALDLKSRKQAQDLVAQDNRDRNGLYAEIAKANGHPEWQADIQATFARRWIANAPNGWWYQGAGGNWKQK